MKLGIIGSGGLASVIACCLFFSGCQTGLTSRQSEKSGGTDFQTMWTTYRACRTGSDLETVTHQADTLRKLVPRAQANKFGFVTESRAFQFTSLFKTNEPRLSADPQVMALDCWLHAGHLAASAGQHQLAYDYYSDILHSPRTPATYYYLGIAQTRLMSLPMSLHATQASSSPYPPN